MPNSFLKSKVHHTQLQTRWNLVLLVSWVILNTCGVCKDNRLWGEGVAMIGLVGMRRAWASVVHVLWSFREFNYYAL